MLADAIPDGVVRFLARPYVAGDSLGAALEVAADLASEGLLTTLDLLGENVRETRQVEANRKIYTEMIDAVAAHETLAAGRGVTVSLKPSSFTTRPLGSDQWADGADAAAIVTELAGRARERGLGITIDMEDHPWTDFTLELATRLFESGHDVGSVLQTRLHRTERDLERIPAGMRIRLVIGIYREPRELATASKPEMKRRLLAAAARLLERGVFVECATHDAAIVRRFLSEVAPGAPATGPGFELQFLHGVPIHDLVEEIRSGRWTRPGHAPPAVRFYVPFATSWDEATAYCRRRLAENPSVGVYVVRNIVKSFLGGSRAP